MASEIPATARAFWVEAPLVGAIRDEVLPPLEPGAVLVRTLFSGVSRGTEALVWQAEVPATEVERMRCPHQAGEFSFPLKYGYANVGVVEAGPGDLVGRSVFCLFPHQTAYVVERTAVLPLPASVPCERGVLAANMETALNAVWDARPLVGDRVSVIGGGVVGLLTAYLVSRLPGVELELVDLRAEREQLCSQLGFGFALPEQARRQRDLVFHASGSVSGLKTALELAAAEATIVEQSWFGAREATLALGGWFHSGRVTLRSSQVGRVSPNARARFAHRERLELAISLLSDARLDALLEEACPFEALPAAMNALSSPESGRLCQLIRY